jgi:malate/lactate dehydrogenase
MKITIFGAGNVGAACGFAVLYKVKPTELVIIDINKSRVEGEALDLAHAAVTISPHTKMLGSNDVSLIKDSNYIVITAGKPRDANTKSRDDLLEINKKIVSSICEDINTHSPDSKIIVVTNPSTEIATLVKSLCSGHIIAMDNQLDTARLKYYIKKETNLEDIKSKIEGEHGENMQIIFQDSIPKEAAERVKKQVREAGITVIRLKGHTNWGIASRVAEEIK